MSDLEIYVHPGKFEVYAMNELVGFLKAKKSHGWDLFQADGEPMGSVPNMKAGFDMIAELAGLN